MNERTFVISLQSGSRPWLLNSQQKEFAQSKQRRLPTDSDLCAFLAPTFGGDKMSRFRDSAHLIRVAGVFLLGAVAFAAIRATVIPKSFGRYGPYRGAALAEITSHPIVFAGHDVCESCHSDVQEIKAKGVHAGVNCESCHGPQSKHAEDPAAIQPTLPNIATLCVRCHSQNAAKPTGFPQVNAQDHSQGESCKTCHEPHSPGLDTGGKK
jgi:Cytochrome c554 and c-prime